MIDYTTNGETLESLEAYKREADLTEAFQKAGMSESLAKAAAVGITCDSPDLLKRAVDRHLAYEWEKRKHELETQEKQKKEHERQQKQPGEQMNSQDLKALELEVMQSMGILPDQDNQEPDLFMQGFTADLNTPFRRR